MKHVTDDIKTYTPSANLNAYKLLNLCRHNGCKNVALYGAGKHSARILDSLAKQPAEALRILCVLDDNKAGTNLAGIPVIEPGDWSQFNIEAIVISSDCFEEQLYQKALLLKPSVPVIKMYSDGESGLDDRTHQLLADVIGLPSDMHKAGVMMDGVLKAIAAITRYTNLEHTAETGSGKTTLLLSHLSKQHLVFSIDEGNQSITSVKGSPLFKSDSVLWIEGPTQLTLPQYKFQTPLDLALIDGPHGYPFPDMEYMYLYPHLRPGGWLVVDDIHIPTITNLFNFLKEEEMFELMDVVSTTAFFRRTGKPAFPVTYDGWWWQGYNRKYFPLNEHPHMKNVLSCNAEAGITEWTREHNET